MPNVKAQVVGNSALSCAGQQLACTLAKVEGYEFRLVPGGTKDALFREDLTPPFDVVADLVGNEPSNPELLIIQGRLTDVIQLSPGDRPRSAIAILPLEFEAPRPWHLEALRPFSRVLFNSPFIVKDVLEIDPQVKAEVLPLPFPPGWIKGHGLQQKAISYVFANTEKEARETLESHARGETTGSRLVLLGPSPVRTREDWEVFCEAMGLECAGGVSCHIGDHDPERRAAIHRACTRYRCPNGYSPEAMYWASEALACGNVVERLPDDADTPLPLVNTHESTALMLRSIIDAVLREEAETEETVFVGERADVTIAYVIPHGNRGANFVACAVEQLRPELWEGDEIIIADVGSPPGLRRTLDLLASAQGTTLVCADGHWNTSRARNVGAALVTKATHILFLDCDILVPAGLGSELHKRLGEAPDSLCLTLEVGDYTEKVSVNDLPTTSWLGSPNRIRYGSGNTVIPLSAFHAVGAFDESFEGWGSEDNDLLIRLRNRGCTVLPLEGFNHAYHMPHPEAPNRHEEAERNIARLQSLAEDENRVVNPDGWGQGGEVWVERGARRRKGKK